MLMVEPSTVRPCTLLPKPTKAGSPARPPAIVVKATGSPDANGMMAPVPAIPAGPVAPVTPSAPGAPGIPCGPIGPCSPLSPFGPGQPGSPFSPCGPIDPGSPFGPAGPCLQQWEKHWLSHWLELWLYKLFVFMLNISFLYCLQKTPGW